MTHPLEHLQAAVGQIPASAVDAPADAGPEARAAILRLQLRIGKLEARLAKANEQVASLGSQRALGSALCGALGLNPNHVKRLSMDVRPGQWPEFTVVAIATDEDGADLGDLLSRFELRPKEAA